MSHNESYLNIEAMRQKGRHREVRGRWSERERVTMESNGCEAKRKRKKENEGHSKHYVGDQESNEDGDVFKFRSDPGVMCDFSGLVKGPVNIVGYDRSVEFVDFDIVFLGVGLVHEYSSCSSVEEDRGFNSFISFSGFAFDGQGNMD